MAGLLPLPVRGGWDDLSVGLPFPRRGDPKGHGCHGSPSPGPAAACFPSEVTQWLWGTACQDKACESQRYQSLIQPRHTSLECASAERAVRSLDKSDSLGGAGQKKANTAVPFPPLLIFDPSAKTFSVSRRPWVVGGPGTSHIPWCMMTATPGGASLQCFRSESEISINRPNLPPSPLSSVSDPGLCLILHHLSLRNPISLCGLLHGGIMSLS